MSESSEQEILQKKQRVRELMSIDRQLLLMRFPFTGALAMRLELMPVYDCRLDTCSTDYDRIYADVDFYLALTPDERLHVLAHELWHCILMHGLRRQTRNHRIFNIAADIEIYFRLCDEGLAIDAHLPYFEEWREHKYSAEVMYEKMEDLFEAMKRGGEYVHGVDVEHLRNKSNGEGFDEHLKEDTGEKEPMQGDLFKEPYFDRDYEPRWDRRTFERLRGKIVSAAQHYEKMRGMLPGHIMDVVTELLKPQMDWRKMLAQFVTSCYGGSRQWLPPSRRHLVRGLYLQSQRSTTIKAVVAIDTSGSTYGCLPRFFSELNAILQSFGKYELTVIQCDAQISHVETFDEAHPVNPEGWNVYGCGGTDFVPVFDYVRDNAMEPSLLIFFTDGFGTAPAASPGYPVMWLLTNDGEAPAEWGMVAQLGKEARER